MKKSTLIAALATTMLISGAIAVILYHFHFRQRLVLETGARIRVWTDAELTKEFKQGDTLEWGTFDSVPQTIEKDFWIENTGSVDVTLRFDYKREGIPWEWELTWDYDGSELPYEDDLGTPEREDVLKVRLTLEIPDLDFGAGEYWWDGWFEAIPA